MDLRQYKSTPRYLQFSFRLHRQDLRTLRQAVMLQVHRMHFRCEETLASSPGIGILICKNVKDTRQSATSIAFCKISIFELEVLFKVSINVVYITKYNKRINISFCYFRLKCPRLIFRQCNINNVCLLSCIPPDSNN